MIMMPMCDALFPGTRTEAVAHLLDFLVETFNGLMILVHFSLASLSSF